MIESPIEHDTFLYAGHSSDLLITEPHGEIMDNQFFTNPFIAAHKYRNSRFSIESNECESDLLITRTLIRQDSGHPEPHKPLRRPTSTRPFIVPNKTHKNRDFSIECNERAPFIYSAERNEATSTHTYSGRLEVPFLVGLI